MSVPFLARDVAEWTGGHLIQGEKDAAFDGVSIDSRTVAPAQPAYSTADDRGFRQVLSSSRSMGTRIFREVMSSLRSKGRGLGLALYVAGESGPIKIKGSCDKTGVRRRRLVGSTGCVP